MSESHTSLSRTPWIELLLLAAIAGMIVVIARPGILRSRVAVNEEEAIAALRTLAAVEARYHNLYPTAGYTCSLDDLFKAGYIDRELASGVRSGYKLTSGACRSGDPKAKANTEYQWFADPVDNASGTRHFCLDQTKAVRASDLDSGQDCLVRGSEI